ncbi:hypothetical protein NQ317_006866 [Molorchus minor]|uniref:Uncharacterized protein n=1 Tax=Molorchus minor TaxID=1323400 RepID=A0ABQ9K1Q4_9CUCU|nr:hypothetical protein NQ317_006866 [Molorchus minor]
MLKIIYYGMESIFFPKHNLNKLVEDSSKILQVRHYAARKGIMRKKKKAKVKVEVEKVGFIPHNQRDKDKLRQNLESKIIEDTWKKETPNDNVFVAKYFKWIVYPFEEAVKCHRETHHPEMYNQPNANVHLRYPINSTTVKRELLSPSANHLDAQKEANDAGAQLSGGVELIKQIQNGQVSLQDFQFIVAHPDILPGVGCFEGAYEEAGFQIPNWEHSMVIWERVVKRFLNGISYTAVRDEYEKEFGLVDTVIGTLNMDAKHLEENFAALMSPLWSPPSCEKLKIDHNIHLKSDKEANTDQDEEDEEGERVALVQMG